MNYSIFRGQKNIGNCQLKTTDFCHIMVARTKHGGERHEGLSHGSNERSAAVGGKKGDAA